MSRLIILLLLLIASLTACGGSSNDEETLEKILPEPTIAKSTQMFGQAGNLWKPAGDGHGGSPGNLVVLLSSQFNQQFDNCELQTNDGLTTQLLCINDQEWTQTPFSCFTNGNRQTWRANFKCSKAAEVRVVCRDTTQEVTFTVDEARRNQVCSRH